MSELFDKCCKLYPRNYVSVSVELDRHKSGAIYTYCRLYVQDAPTFSIESSTFDGIWHKLSTTERGNNQPLEEIDNETIKHDNKEEEEDE